jgi:hypothetical protein
MLYIGIDNGSSGGIAVLNERGVIYAAVPMPPTDVEIYSSLIEYASADVTRAVLEHAQAFPKMGTSSAFNYGRGYGAMQMALAAASIPFDIVVPRKWMAALSCLTRGDKNISKRRAEQLFPGRRITHATADALLIAEYCRRINRGQQHGEEESRGAQEHTEAPGHAEGSEGVGARKEKGAGRAAAARHGASAQRAARSVL